MQFGIGLFEPLQHRLMALGALRQLGVQTAGFGDSMEYEESVAPWNQQVPLKTP